ncbi:hypothetical protein LSAT2_013336 [Lamellibrachia satsuma]|nr:hypothetical protein LSAT2_013336 [Lamellibrachia satsuma]
MKCIAGLLADTIASIFNDPLERLKPLELRKCVLTQLRKPGKPIVLHTNDLLVGLKGKEDCSVGHFYMFQHETVAVWTRTAVFLSSYIMSQPSAESFRLLNTHHDDIIGMASDKQLIIHDVSFGDLPHLLGILVLTEPSKKMHLVELNLYQESWKIHDIHGIAGASCSLMFLKVGTDQLAFVGRQQNVLQTPWTVSQCDIVPKQPGTVGTWRKHSASCC